MLEDDSILINPAKVLHGFVIMNMPTNAKIDNFAFNEFIKQTEEIDAELVEVCFANSTCKTMQSLCKLNNCCIYVNEKGQIAVKRLTEGDLC